MNDGHALVSTLEPVLRDACRGHLSPVRWFEAIWQHGGAGTGFAEWTTARGRTIDCVVKFPVGYPEYAWTKRLGLTGEDDWDSPEALDLPTPRVLAGGFELGSYDFAWLVMERFPGMPLGGAAHGMDAGDIWSLFETTARFHAAAVLEQAVDTERPARAHDWEGLLDRAIREMDGAFLTDGLGGWPTALDRTRELLPDLVARWNARPIDTWCHRDVHAHNAMRRAPAEGEGRGALALIDLARIAPGCWIEDALYLERLCWGRDEVLQGVDPLTTLAKARRNLGLPAPDEDLALADVRRVLMAATSPAFSRTQGDPMYLRAALERLERLLPAVCG